MSLRRPTGLLELAAARGNEQAISQLKTRNTREKQYTKPLFHAKERREKRRAKTTAQRVTARNMPHQPRKESYRTR